MAEKNDAGGSPGQPSGGKAGRAGKPGGGKLVLVAGGKPKLRKRAKRNWTKAKEVEFLTALAETCNVTRAAAEAGLSSRHAYRRRKSHAAFRAAWREAIATAYGKLELAMLERSLNGTERVIRRKDGSEERVREYPNAIALTLLKMHRDTAIEAETEVSEEQAAEVRQRLFDKLQRLRQRFAQEDPQGE